MPHLCFTQIRLSRTSDRHKISLFGPLAVQMHNFIVVFGDGEPLTNESQIDPKQLDAFVPRAA